MILERIGYKIERRPEVTPWVHAGSLAIALLAAMVVSSILIMSAKANLSEAFTAILGGGFGSPTSFTETLVKTTPLILTGLAATIAFRARIWNIGAEGQLILGAMAAYAVVFYLPGLPKFAMVTGLLAAGALGGAIWGWIPGFLKARLKIDEIIVTVMLNYIARYMLSFVLSGPWKDPKSFYLQTSELPKTGYLPLLVQDSRLHIGFALALLLALVFYILLWRTPFGFEIRALGLNPTASRFKGTNIGHTIILVMMLSGAIAGLAGAGELAGLHHRMRLDITTGYGFTGIIIAMLGGLHPFGVVLAAIFFGALSNGSVRMQIVTGVPVAVVYAIQAIVLLFLLTADVISKYQIRKAEPC